MRYRYIFLLCFMLLGTSCESTEELVAPPADLLSKDQMVSILIDLHLAEAKMSYTGSRKADSIEIIFRNYERAIFDEHSITDSTYFRSYEYYLEHMDQMERIYTAVVDSFSVMNSLEKAKDLGIANR
ncbi:MAG: DUF4296 domain-containing protein [Bacteroidota bacterium]